MPDAFFKDSNPRIVSIAFHFISRGQEPTALEEESYRDFSDFSLQAPSEEKAPSVSQLARVV